MALFKNVLEQLTGDPLKDVLIIKLAEQELGMIVDDIFTPNPVNKRSSKLKVMGYTDKIRNDSYRADRDPAKETLQIGFSNVEYDCKSIDERVFITNSELNDQGTEADILKQASVQALAGLINLKREKMGSAIATNASLYGSNTDTPSAKFTTDATKPVKYILEKAGLLRKNGVLADSIAFGWSSFESFINNPTVAALLPDSKYKTVTGVDVLPIFKTAGLINLQNVYVGGGVYDSNATSDTRTPTDLWLDDIIIFKKAKSVNGGLVERGAFLGNYMMDEENFGAMEYKDEVNKLKGIWLEDRFAYDPMILDIDCAFLIKDTNA